MKATGVVRRIDELGRIVIPKEIRKNFRIKDGENIEIFISEEDSIILKKISTLNNIENISSIITSVIKEITNKCVFITDTNNIINIEGKNKDKYLDRNLMDDYLKLLEKRKKIEEIKPNRINIIGEEIVASYIIEPIIIGGDLLGSIGILSENSIDNKDTIIIDMALKILIKYLEQ